MIRCAGASGCRRRARDAIRAELIAVAPKVLPFMAATFEILDSERRAGKRILFEGAQGAMLDVDHGTYPYVTSSNTVAANAATGSGLGPRAIGYVLGIAKAYTTRVGGGPFPDRARRRNRPPHRPARRTNSAPIPAGRADAAGSTPCSRARRSAPAASTVSR